MVQSGPADEEHRWVRNRGSADHHADSDMACLSDAETATRLGAVEHDAAVNPFKVAVVQAASVIFDREATLDKVAALIERAAAAEARLTVFPEAFVSGYPRGVSFGSVVGNRTREGREHFRRYWDSAVDMPGPDTDRLASIAAETGQHLVIGVIERDRGTLYCSALFFSPKGYLGKHRKLMPTAAERAIWGFGDGSTLPVFDTPIGKIGAVICWENYMPLLRTVMYSKEYNCGAHRRPMAARHGYRRCVTSQGRADASFCPVTSSPA